MQGHGPLDFTPLLAPPARTDDLDEPLNPARLDWQHVAAVGSRHNGLPEVLPYVWRPGDAEREAGVQARIAAVRARLREEAP